MTVLDFRVRVGGRGQLNDQSECVTISIEVNSGNGQVEYFSHAINHMSSDFDYAWKNIERVIRDHFKINENQKLYNENQEQLKLLEQLEDRVCELEEEKEILAEELAESKDCS